MTTEGKSEAVVASADQPFYGSVEFMPEALLRKRTAQLKNELLELMEEKKRRDAFTSTERLADRLHALLHRKEDCDYNYSKWPAVGATGCRREFYQMAKSLEDISGSDDLKSILSVLESRG